MRSSTTSTEPIGIPPSLAPSRASSIAASRNESLMTLLGDRPHLHAKWSRRMIVAACNLDDLHRRGFMSGPRRTLRMVHATLGVLLGFAVAAVPHCVSAQQPMSFDASSMATPLRFRYIGP